MECVEDVAHAQTTGSLELNLPRRLWSARWLNDSPNRCKVSGFGRNKASRVVNAPTRLSPQRLLRNASKAGFGMSLLLQIVPSLPPSIGGVGEHALLLGGEMSRSCAQRSIFLVGDPTWERPPESAEFEVRKVVRRCALDLQEQSVGLQTILLHYVGYGYATRGVPFWLHNGLRKIVRGGRVKLLTFFHELYGFGPPWRSSFWLSPLQRWVCARLAVLSDVRYTNREESAQILRAMSPRHSGRIGVWPVLSNFGEPASLLPLPGRLPQLVIYGGVSRSSGGLRASIANLRVCCERLGIKRIVSFGRIPIVGLDFLPVEYRGVLPVEEVSYILKKSRAGYVDYDARFLGKSGIFAAYCAHGLVPILPHTTATSGDGLVPTVHFLASDNLPRTLNLEFAERIAATAHAWYAQHNLSVAASAIAGNIESLRDRRHILEKA